MATRVFLCKTLADRALLDALAATLPPDRAALAGRARTQGGYAQAVLSFCLVRYALHRFCPAADPAHWVIGEHGKPSLADGRAHFNLSHSDHCIAVAVSDRAVGIDIEELKPHKNRLADRICSPAEREALSLSSAPTHELIRLWCAKEAVGKQLGTGLLRPYEINAAEADTLTLSVDGVAHLLALSPSPLPPPEWVGAPDLLVTTLKEKG